MAIDMDMAEIHAIFIEESREGLDVMETGLLNLESGAADPETMNEIFRAAHSIKGGGATFGFTAVSEFTHDIETLLDEMRQGDRPVTADTTQLLLETVDCIREMVAAVGTGDEDGGERAAALQARLRAALRERPRPPAADTPPETVPAGNDAGWHIRFRPGPDLFRTGNEPLRIFRELQSLGELNVTALGVENLDCRTMNPQDCLIGWDLRLKTRCAEESVRELLAWVDDDGAVAIEPLESMVKKPVPEKDQPSGRRLQAQESGSIRVGTDKIDRLINLVGELVITQSMLNRFDGDFDHSMLPGLQHGLDQLRRNTQDLQESVLQIRMLPISSAFSRFPRLVHDLCNELGKKAELKLSGENTELDKTVLEKIGDPLIHLVRNSLDHGLEDPETRRRNGKPETGTLGLNAYHEGGNIVIEVTDDGAGINREKVLRKARDQGIVQPGEELSDERICNLIFAPGFSTAEQVSDLSGRGVGLDVVSRNMTELGGSVSVESETGLGTRLTIRLPLTLAILEGQLIRVGEAVYIASLISIVETTQIGDGDYHSVAGGAQVFRLRDGYLPILRLHELFGIEPDSQQPEDGLLVVAESGGRRVGILVDDLLEQQQVVIKSLESNFRHVPGLSGATILGDGTVALILDVPGLIELFFQQGKTLYSPTADVA